MRFKLTVLAFAFSTTLSAQTWTEYLKSDLDKKLTHLENKMIQCNGEISKLAVIHEPWFTSLSRDEKAAAGAYIKMLVQNRCLSDERKEYATTLFSYSAEVGDNETMQDWLALENVYRASSHEGVFKTLDVSNLVEFVDKHPTVKGFNLYEFLQNYDEFK
ncbi:hypothetical protein RCJ22_22015 [Vibrio sp. FNV 38]|nr:hypothetical protein [Vibrio sp. FNV 38]